MSVAVLDFRSDSSGATLSFGVAVNFPIAHSGFITIEPGYQLGKQIVEIDGIDVDASSNLIHVGVGLGSYL